MARTVNGFPLAIPLRFQASDGRLRKNETVATRIWRNSSICRDQEIALAPAVRTAISCSKLGRGLSNARANQSARYTKTRSASFTWFNASRMLHLSGPYRYSDLSSEMPRKNVVV